MIKKLIVLLVIAFSFLLAIPLSANGGYTFFVVDQIEDIEGASCGDPDSVCTLSSALAISDATDINSALLVNIPFTSLTEREIDQSKTIPFYVIKEVSEDGDVWKVLPAPLTPTTDLSNLDQDITDYFLTVNTGSLNGTDLSAFFGSVFFGQFRKFYNANTAPNDYDVKLPVYRIVEIPRETIVFSDVAEVESYLNQIQSGELSYQKFIVDGFSLRIYEESFSSAVILILSTLTLVVVALNLIIFPSMILYFILLVTNKVKRSKVIGIVYDHEKGVPIRFATVRVYKMDNGVKTFLKQAISDSDGKYYGFAVDKGEYVMEVKHSYYGVKEIGKTAFEDSELIVEDIGMTKEKSSSREGLIVRTRGYLNRNLMRINGRLIVFSFIIAIINILVVQNTFNLIILLIASLLLIIYKMLDTRRDWGVVVDSSTDLPVRAAFVKVYNPKDFTQITTQLSDEKGTFGFILASNSEYLLLVEASGYKFPSKKDMNALFTGATGQNFVKLNTSKSTKIDKKILIDRSIV